MRYYWFLIFLFLTTGALAQEVQRPDVIAVKFHADWCGSCKAMGPAFEDLASKFDGQKTLFVTLDQTNMTTRNQARLLASALDLEDVWKEYGGKTGFILLIDPDSGKVWDRLTPDHSLKDMSALLATRLAK